MAEIVAVPRRRAAIEVTARAWRELRRWPIFPAVVLIGLAMLAIFARQIAPYDPYEVNVYARNAPPTWASGTWYEERPGVEGRYFLGADYVGRDVLSRIIYGARISLMISAIAAGAGMTIGSTVGIVAGYFGGWMDEIVMRLVDAWSAMPFILLALVVAILLGASVKTMMILLALLAWESFVRNVRAEVLSLKTRDYVSLARVAGAPNGRIIVRHILPGVINTIVIITTLRLGGLIMGEATLSFLGAGIPAPTPAWGLMVSEGRNYVATAYWTALFPGLFILMLVMSFNFLGDWLRDRLDPRLSQL